MRGAEGGPLDVVLLTDRFPELSQTFVAEEARALQRAGHRVRIVAARPGERPEPALAEGLDVHHTCDETPTERIAAMARLALRRPRAVLRDLRDRRRWQRDETVPPLRNLAPTALRLEGAPHARLHVHFAAGAALDALRIARLLDDRPWSLTAHAYEIWATPMNLAEKLRAASVVTTGCAYNADHLAKLRGGDVHEIVMGVDLDAFARRTPHPNGRTVVAVGRLVEKKGFADLVDAAAIAREAIRSVVIAGDGPLRPELERRVRDHGLGGVVELAGALSPAAVRDLLERADLLAMPCVVATDGDRDSMPVVVKEALAMEVPVVATNEVGLPEIVTSDHGRLVPPRDPHALANAIEEILELPPDERAAMGRAGRAFVREHANVDTEAEKLTRLLMAL